MNEPVPLLSAEDQRALEVAYSHLEHPSLAARLTHLVGTPIEIALHLLPKTWYDPLQRGVERAIAKALDSAIVTLHQDHDTRPLAHPAFYKLLGAATGAVGGLFGLPALLIELPITTTVMLSAIADVARSEGADLNALDTRLDCMQVFALGGRSDEDDAADLGYYGVRLAVSVSVSNAARHIAEHGLGKEGGPALVSLIRAVATRFGGVISEKATAQLVPLIGAASAAFLNTIFIQHFQDTARGHFTIRRLERRYGVETVQAAYQRLDG
jgi:hypothetical protein